MQEIIIRITADFLKTACYHLIQRACHIPVSVHAWLICDMKKEKQTPEVDCGTFHLLFMALILVQIA